MNARHVPPCPAMSRHVPPFVCHDVTKPLPMVNKPITFWQRCLKFLDAVNAYGESDLFAAVAVGAFVVGYISFFINWMVKP